MQPGTGLKNIFGRLGQNSTRTNQLVAVLCFGIKQRTGNCKNNMVLFQCHVGGDQGARFGPGLDNNHTAVNSRNYQVPSGEVKGCTGGHNDTTI